ncbi:P pilus assembly protein, pilin FimA [Serratia quinivorans]|nr:P pilus assembly protein, pilin FimA [Serratia quinivorans]CAI2161021.1 P pilus assembly protein, pilin FimA [Serratia quinivorans]
MNKSMRIFLLATALSGATSGMAFAADTSAQSGTLNFTGLLTEGSCVLSGNNIEHNFGTLSKAQQPIQTGPNGSTGFKAYKVYNDTISVTNCPEEVTKVVMVPTFVQVTGGPNIIKNTAAAPAANVAMLIGPDINVTRAFKNNIAQTYPVSADTRAVDIPILTQVSQMVTEPVTAGNAIFDVTLAFDYK